MTENKRSHLGFFPNFLIENKTMRPTILHVNSQRPVIAFKCSRTKIKLELFLVPTAKGGLSGGAIFGIILMFGIIVGLVGFLVHASIYRPDRILAIKRRLGLVRSRSGMTRVGYINLWCHQYWDMPETNCWKFVNCVLWAKRQIAARKWIFFRDQYFFYRIYVELYDLWSVWNRLFY